MPLSFAIGLAALFSVCLMIYSTRFFQMIQQYGYNCKKFLKWLFSRGLFELCTGVVITSAAFISEFFNINPVLFMPIVGVTGFFILYKIPSALPVKVTRRLIRLAAAATAVWFMASMLSIYFGMNAMSYAALALSPFIVLLVNVMLRPLEKQISESYLRRAEAKLKRIHPLKIAVTGSYGKTTAKNMLAEMLKTRYRVCATPLSYNTPSGISVAVNDNLKEGDEIFIAEMGARKQGDIAFLTRTVMPEIAVITAVGNQHLETFGSLENIKKAKSELPENLPCGGRAYFNGDNSVVYEMYTKYGGNKTLTGKTGDVRYDNVVMSVKGTEFDLIAGGKCVRVCTKLIGKHIPSMICLCASVALELGVTLSEIKNAISALQPVAHRLQMLYNGSDVIIDDSFSSNEAGFESATEVLSQFSYLIKVIITPGVVELGKAQYDVNYRLGRLAAKSCDYLIVIGGNAQPLKRGALSAGLPPRCVIEAKSRTEAMEHYKKIRGGKAVLFENDLPDSYG